MLCFAANLMALLASSALSTVTYLAAVELAALETRAGAARGCGAPPGL